MSRPFNGAAGTTKLHSIKGDSQRGVNARRSLLYDERAQDPNPPLTEEDVQIPEDMPPGMRKPFKEALARLIALDIATQNDAMSVAMLCETWAELRYVSFLINAEGYMIEEENAKGEIRQRANPLLNERSKLRTFLKTLLTQFGLTPSTRKNVFARDPEKPKDTEDEVWRDFFSGSAS